MITIWIVMKNGKVDEVFDNFTSAVNHKKNLTGVWALTELIEKKVCSI